jgi:hypothetical protein
MLRLGHIALVALGMMNLLVAQPSLWLVAGGVTMPVVCFLTAWRRCCRHLFVVPVACLVVAVVLVMAGGRDGARPSTIVGGPRSVVAGENHGGMR